MKHPAGQIVFAFIAICAAENISAQEVIRCGEGSYASYAPWRVARSTRHWGDQSRIMQTRPIYMTERRKGEPVPTNDWWTDVLVSQWGGFLWSYPAKLKIAQDGVWISYPEYWIDNGTEMKPRSALLVGGDGDFSPSATLVDDWHDFDVSMVLRDGAKEIKTTLVHGSPFMWIESSGIALKIAIENDENQAVKRRSKGSSGEIVTIGNVSYGIWRGTRAGGGGT